MIRSLIADLVDSSGRPHRGPLFSNSEDNQNSNISNFPSKQHPQPSGDQLHDQFHQRTLSSVPSTQNHNDIPSGASMSGVSTGRKTSFRQASVFDILSPPGADAEEGDAEDGTEEEVFGSGAGGADSSGADNGSPDSNPTFEDSPEGDSESAEGSSPGDDDVDESSGGLSSLADINNGNSSKTISRYSDNQQDEEHLDDIERVFGAHEDSELKESIEGIV
jgi:hypothetical protein